MKKEKNVSTQELLGLDVEINKLIIEDDTAKAFIVDEELDVFECSFNYSNDVQIHTKGYEYIILTPSHFKILNKLIKESEEHYKNYFINNKNQ